MRKRWVDHAPPQRWDQGEGAAKGKGVGQHRGLIGIGEAQGGVGAGGMGVMVGMAGRVEHQAGGKPVRGIPAVPVADGFGAAIGAKAAHQAVVLNIIGEQKLGLCVGGKQKPDTHAGPTGSDMGNGESEDRAAQIEPKGVQAGHLHAPGGFCGKTRAERTCPGAAGKAVIAFPGAGGVGVGDGGSMAVMHQPVGRGVVPEEERDIDRHAEPEQPAIAPVDQFMRDRVRHLSEHQTGTKAEKGAFPGGQAGRPGEGPDNRGQRHEMGKGERDKQGVACRKFGAIAGGQVGQGLIEEGGEGGDINQGCSHPRPAEGQSGCNQREGQQTGKGKQGNGGMKQAHKNSLAPLPGHESPKDAAGCFHFGA